MSLTYIQQQLAIYRTAYDTYKAFSPCIANHALQRIDELEFLIATCQYDVD